MSAGNFLRFPLAIHFACFAVNTNLLPGVHICFPVSAENAAELHAGGN
jgi:hypothetical protein